jgi:4-hydroxy-tetrahydrodipicolinate synthase
LENLASSIKNWNHHTILRKSIIFVLLKKIMSFQTTLPAGVFAASLTPLKNDLSIDCDALVAHCKWLLANGNNGIALLGSTGEANSFTLEERLQLIDAVLAGGIPPEKLIVGTGCCAFPDTVVLTKHAVSQGVGGVLMLPPFYYKAVTDAGLANYFELVINQINDVRLRIYLYHFPQLAQVSFSTPLVKLLVKEFPGIVVGMKDSSGDWENMQEICRELPGFKLYSGTEKYLLGTMRIGGAGCITATTNAIAPFAQQVFQNWQSENAATLQNHLTKLRAAFEGYSYVSVLKYMFAKWSGNSAWLNLRPPNSKLQEKEAAIVTERLNALGFDLDLKN